MDLSPRSPQDEETRTRTTADQGVQGSIIQGRGSPTPALFLSYGAFGSEQEGEVLDMLRLNGPEMPVIQGQNQIRLQSLGQRCD